MATTKAEARRLARSVTGGSYGGVDANASHKSSSGWNWSVSGTARVRAVSPDRTAVRKVSDTFGNAGDDGAPQGVRHLCGYVRDRALASRRAEAVPEAPAVAAARAPDLTNPLAASFHS